MDHPPPATDVIGQAQSLYDDNVPNNIRRLKTDSMIVHPSTETVSSTETIAASDGVGLTQQGRAPRLNDFEFSQQGRATHSPSLVSSTTGTSTDLDDAGPVDPNELDELISSVKQYAPTGRVKLTQDGFSSRYTMRVVKPKEESANRPESEEGASLLPQPLSLRTNTAESDDPDNPDMDVLEFLGWLETNAQENNARERATSVAKAEELRKALEASPWSAVKQWVKEQKKKKAKSDGEEKAKSPLLSRIVSRTTSSTKLTGRDSAADSKSNLGAVTPSPAGSIHTASSPLPYGESDLKSTARNQAHPSQSGKEPIFTPPPKSNRRRPSLFLNTDNGKFSPSLEPQTATRGTPGTPGALANARQDADYFSRRENEDQTSQPSTPLSRGRSKSVTSVTDKGKKKRSSSSDFISSVLSFASGKKKPQKYTDDDPEIKMIERMYLKEAFDVDSTKDLIAKDEGKPSPLKALISRPMAAPMNPIQAPSESQIVSTDPSPLSGPAPPVSAAMLKSIGTTPPRPPRPTRDSVPSPMAKQAMRYPPDVTTSRFISSQQTPASAASSASPVSPDSGGSMRIRRKEVGSGAAKAGGAVTSPVYEHFDGSGSVESLAGIAISSNQAITASPTNFSYPGAEPVRGNNDSPRRTFGRISSFVQGAPKVVPKGHGSSDIEPTVNEAAKHTSYADTRENDNTGTTQSSRVSSASEAAGPRASGSQRGSMSAAASRTSGTSSFSEATPIAIHGADFEASDVGQPSARHKYEEEAAQKAVDLKMSKEDHVRYRINQLRHATGSVLVWDHSIAPHTLHPNHGLEFHQKNLMCLTCHANCPICDAPCCAFKGALQTAKKYPDSPAAEDAKELARSISKWVNGGCDLDTFIECLQCHKKVCPHCMGVCPIVLCRDRICSDCNPGRLWTVCEFHTKDELRTSEQLKEDGYQY